MWRRSIGYEPIRYLMVASHYRSPINYSVEVIEQCKAALERLYNCRDNLAFLLKNAPEGEKEGEKEIRRRFERIPGPLHRGDGGRFEHGGCTVGAV